MRELEEKNTWLAMFLQLPPQPWLRRTNVTMGNDWMDQSVDGCKDILPGDQMKEVSSHFALIAPQGTIPSPTSVSWRPKDLLLCSPERMWRRLLISSPSWQRKPFNFRVFAVMGEGLNLKRLTYSQWHIQRRYFIIYIYLIGNGKRLYIESTCVLQQSLHFKGKVIFLKPHISVQVNSMCIILNEKSNKTIKVGGANFSVVQVNNCHQWCHLSIKAATLFIIWQTIENVMEMQHFCLSHTACIWEMLQSPHHSTQILCFVCRYFQPLSVQWSWSLSNLKAHVSHTSWFSC